MNEVEHRAGQRLDSSRRIVAIGFLMLLLLLVPVDMALTAAGAGELRIAHLISTTAALTALLALASLMGRWVGLAFLSATLAFALVVRSVYFGLVRFSGRGFTDEVFLHLERESFRVAWMEYPGLVMILAGLLALLAWAVVRHGRAACRLPRAAALWLLLPSMGVLASTSAALPEVQFATAAHRWYSPRTVPLAPAELQRWRDSGLVELDVPVKQEVVAEAATSPSNLILLFIESGGAALARHPDYEDLMPTLRGLMERHSLVGEFHASAYITIEGLVNSMCGTLFPFQQGSDAMAGSDGLAESMPCLGDVLRLAGYRQTYMGGAGLAFAGKGAFLLAHGYDTALGIDQWREHGLGERPGTWGLSDADLLEQSHGEIERLRASGRPFNLTLLTIGTHLPGYSYAECAPFRDGAERFLNAVSCTDQLLARWIARLERDGQLEDTMLVITADHHIFPNPEMKRLFGEAALSDRRLPLVVLGGQHDAPPVSGAGYDLAPTLLDLLGVRHNARFALGRSLLADDGERGAFFRKYEDVVDGRAADNPGSSNCGDTGRDPPRPPLDGCDKRALLDLLALQHAAFSLERAEVQCEGVGSSGVRVPISPGTPVRFLVGGRDESGRFTRNSRAVKPDSPGLYVLVLDADGAAVERIHVPAEAAEREAAGLPGVDDARALLVAWLGGDEHRSQRPKWLPPTAASSSGWLIDADSGAVVRSATHDEVGAELYIGEQECRQVFGSS